MDLKNQSLSQVRNIDNSRQWLPFATTFLIVFLLVIGVWFFRGGSFRLYASIFFGFYYLTHQIWVSVLLIGVTQNIVFLPLRFIWLKFATSLKDMEEEIDSIKSNNDQYFLLTQKVRQGNLAVIFYIFSLILNIIAFFSAGRVFLIDFYTQKLDPNLLYSFIPYPQYPLQGTDFYFPFFKVTQTHAFSWGIILTYWLYIVIFLVALRLFWRLTKFILHRSRRVLSIRIGYNRLIVAISGIIGSIFILSLIIFRHFPTGFAPLWLVADLTHQNTTMNFITAIATFITTLHAGYIHHRLALRQAQKAGFAKDTIDLLFRQRMRQSFNNALLLGLGAFFITNQIPCAFELSVATFEALYIIAPYTLDRFLLSINPTPSANEPQIQS
ncbi:MAG: hypothetical protein WCV93_05370 [Candidatus Shapirobacteria bacterium]